MNLGRNVRDDTEALAENRRRLQALLPAAPTWLDQVHGAAVVTLTAAAPSLPSPVADAAVTRERGVVCAVLTADCLPVLFADRGGNAVGIAHAGWRGLAAGVLEATIAALGNLGARADDLVAWLGPAIGPARFEVGADVHERFCADDPEAGICFTPHGPGKWHADLYGLARARLRAAECRRWAAAAIARIPTPRAFSRIVASATRAGWPPRVARRARQTLTGRRVSREPGSKGGASFAMRIMRVPAAMRSPMRNPGPCRAPSRPAALSILMQIVAAALAGGVFATAAAAGTLVLHRSWISRIVSFAVGALLGAVFLELLPHALETGDAERVMATVLAGLLAFFALEKLVLWRHAHGHDAHEDDAEESEHEHALHADGTDQGRSGLMILIGTSVHNFCDGVVIAASFLASSALGVATTVAIVAHAVPQQVGDFAVLVHSGYARSRAFVYNVSVAIATLAGALAGYVALADMQQALPTALAIAASSLLYVAVADLIPSLHRRPEPLETAKQLLLIGLGIAVIALAHLWFEH